MNSLGYPDVHHVRAAEGWLELGDSDEAARELRRISRGNEGHPDVLELRWRLLAAHGRWDAALDLATALMMVDDSRISGWIHRSYTLHELKRTDEAWELLLPAARKFPKDFTVAYNLACYACRLGAMQEARDWIQRAVKLRGRDVLKQQALTDPDLADLRDYIETL